MKMPSRWPMIRRALLGMTDTERRWLRAWVDHYINQETGELSVRRGRWDEDDGGADIGAVSVTPPTSRHVRM